MLKRHCLPVKAGKEKCCIQDLNVNKTACIAITATKNMPCKNPAQKDMQYCHLHRKMCIQSYNNYKTVCARVWNIDCSKIPTKNLEEIIANIDQCKRLRLDYYHECIQKEFSGKLDQGHFGALKKMEHLKEMCTRELRQRD